MKPGTFNHDLPNQLFGSDLKLYLNPDREGGLSYSGGVVTSCNDFSGNDNHEVPGSANAPSVSHVAGRKVLKSDQSNSEGMITTNAIDLSPLDEVLFMRFVAPGTGITTAAPVLYQGTFTTLSSTKFGIRPATLITNPLSMDYAANPDPDIGTDFSTDFKGGALLGFYHNRNFPVGGAATIKAWINGVQKASSSTPNQALGNDKFMWGNWNDSHLADLYMGIEIVIYPVPTDVYKINLLGQWIASYYNKPYSNGTLAL